MNINRIKGVVLRHLIYWTRSLNRLTDVFWWPMVSLLVWGLFTIYARENLPLITAWLLGALVLWIIIQRSQNEVSVCLMDEVWSENLLNLFSTPLTFGEFLMGILIASVVKLAVVVFMLTVTAYFLYQYNIFSLGYYVVPFVAILTVFGWTLGIIINSLILRFGRDAEALAWTAIVAVQPFSCVFYPLYVLPGFVQKVALLLPSTYIFEGLRSLVYTGYLPAFYLLAAGFLSVIYFVGSLFLFRHTLIRSKELGLLTKLVD